jgi:hypothetical protein
MSWCLMVLFLFMISVNSKTHPHVSKTNLWCMMHVLTIEVHTQERHHLKSLKQS